LKCLRSTTFGSKDIGIKNHILWQRLNSFDLNEASWVLLFHYIYLREMLELSCKEFWRYSNITCCGYPLGALDSIQVGDVTEQTKTEGDKGIQKFLKSSS